MQKAQTCFHMVFFFWRKGLEVTFFHDSQKQSCVIRAQQLNCPTRPLVWRVVSECRSCKWMCKSSSPCILPAMCSVEVCSLIRSLSLSLPLFPSLSLPPSLGLSALSSSPVVLSGRPLSLVLSSVTTPPRVIRNKRFKL